MIKQPKFSIIMPVYNVADYIEEAVESIVNQDIGFLDNVQIILVNDGSTDESGGICKQFKDKYPNNVCLINKSNGGLVSARNAGLKYATGQLLNFFDPDDILTSNVLSSVWQFWTKNNLFIDTISIPLVYFEAQTGLHAKYSRMGNKNRIIDLRLESHNFILSSASTFYRRTVFDKVQFDPELSWNEDARLNATLYRDNPKFGYVCQDGVKYMYRRRLASTSNVDTSRENPDFVKQSLKVLPWVSKESPAYEKEFLSYILRASLGQCAKNTFANQRDYHKTISDISKTISDCFGVDFVERYCPWINDLRRRTAFLKLMSVDSAHELVANRLPFSNDIFIREQRPAHNHIDFDVIFNNYGCPIDVIAYDGNNVVYNPIESNDLESPYDVEYGEFKPSKTCHRIFRFNLTKNKVLRFCFVNTTTNEYIPIRHIKLLRGSRLQLRSSDCGVRYKNKIITFNGRKIKVANNKHKSSLSYNISTTISIYRQFHKLPLLRLTAKRTKRYILINDRPNKADDNGEALFKHINNCYPNLAKYTYYVIGDVNKHEFQRLKKIGHIIKHGSIKHKIAFLNAKYIFSSHNHPAFFSAFNSNSRQYYSDLLSYTFTWLQHGVTMNDISRACNRLHVEDDFVVTATINEANELKQNKYFYNDKSILTTGFPRYDLLSSNSRDIITFMPTWRNNLSGPINERGEHTAIPDFDRSNYYRQIVDILTSKKLDALLCSNNLHFNFIMHAGIEEYADCFTKFNTDRVHIVKGSNYSYRKAFSESKLLITDYSSVAFDFAYLKKPVIYYQFDEQEFFTKHYRRGYFDYRKNGFGEVATTARQVVSLLESYANNNFLLKQKYSRRIDETFHYRDHNNCERVLRAVLPEGLLQ